MAAVSVERSIRVRKLTTEKHCLYLVMMSKEVFGSNRSHSLAENHWKGM